MKLKANNQPVERCAIDKGAMGAVIPGRVLLTVPAHRASAGRQRVRAAAAGVWQYRQIIAAAAAQIKLPSGLRAAKHTVPRPQARLYDL